MHIFTLSHFYQITSNRLVWLIVVCNLAKSLFSIFYIIMLDTFEITAQILSNQETRSERISNTIFCIFWYQRGSNSLKINILLHTLNVWMREQGYFNIQNTLYNSIYIYRVDVTFGFIHWEQDCGLRVITLPSSMHVWWDFKRSKRVMLLWCPLTLEWRSVRTCLW